MPLKVDTDGPAWPQWSMKYHHEGQAIPIIWIIRGDGTQLYGKSGSLGGELGPFMLQYLSQAGRILSEGQLAQLSDTAENVKKAITANDMSSAIHKLATVQKIGTPGKIGSYAEPARQVDELALKLTEQGKAELDKVKKMLAAPDTAFEGGIRLLNLKKSYLTLPTLKVEILSALREAAANPAAKDAVEQANLWQHAESYAKSREHAASAAALRQIVMRWPDSAVARRANEALQKLGSSATDPATQSAAAEKTPALAGGSPAEAQAGSEKPAAGGGSVVAHKKAVSALRMAKFFAKSHPEKARQYAQAVIDTSPDSDEAQEARELLDQLK